MLPPIAPSVFENNPKFKVLYQNLASSRLNPDASTRLIKQQRAQADIEKQLLTARKEAAQNTLLQDALSAITMRASQLPPELVETCHIISAQLNGELSPADLEVLEDEIDYFVENIPTIAQAISTHLTKTASLVSTLLNAAVPGSSTDDLLSQSSTLQENIQTQSTSISLTRSRVTELSDQIHSAYRDLFETSIRIIEQVIHGSVSRGNKARAEHLAVVAKGMSLKLQILAKTDAMLTDPGLNAELRVYGEKLEGTEEQLSQRVADADRALAEYGGAGKGMEGIAGRYAEVLKECEAVRQEIAKLKERASDVD